MGLVIRMTICREIWGAAKLVAHLHSHHFPAMGAEQLAMYWSPSEMSVLFRATQQLLWGGLGLLE